MMTNIKTVLIIEANKGIGFETQTAGMLISNMEKMKNT
jgi:hypothetical protein